MESFKIPYYYVWGLPNREHNLASIIYIIENPDNYEVSEGALARFTEEKKRKNRQHLFFIKNHLRRIEQSS